MKTFKQIIYLVVTSLLISTSYVSAQSVKADVKQVVQTQSNWCWAANSECIMSYYGTDVTQCKINNYAWSKSNCCSSPGSCNQTNYIGGKGAIDDIIMNFANLKSTHTKSALSVNKIVSSLTEKRPFVLGVFWNSGGGHVVVGCGYNESTGTITTMDPWRNNGISTSKFSGGSNITLSGSSGRWAESLEVLDKPISTSTNETLSDKLYNVFPSPSNGTFQINFYSEANEASIEVNNILGERVLAEKLQTTSNTLNKHEIDISTLPNGSYLVSVQSGAKRFNKMVVKN